MPSALPPGRRRRPPGALPQGIARVGVIDLGSNTARLVVYEIGTGGRHRVVFDLKEVPRVGAFIDAAGRISREGVTRTVATLRSFAQLCRHLRARRIEAVATSAVRESKNGRAVVRLIRDRTGVRLRVLTGQEEARLALRGVEGSLPLTEGVLFDLGGGSLQLVRFDRDRILASTSLRLGALAVTQQFLPKGKATHPRIKRLRRHVRELLDGLPRGFRRRGLQLVGVGGTVRTLARVDQELHGYPLPLVHGYSLEHERIGELVHLFEDLDPARRSEVPGVSEHRGDIILGGAIVIDEVLRALDTPSVMISGHGVREGVLREDVLEPPAPGQTLLIPHHREHQLHHTLHTAVENLAFWHGVDRRHADHVRHLGLSLFDQLRPYHRLGAGERQVLAVAATVHDVGISVDYHEHAQHSAYIILGSDLGGLPHRDQIRIALAVLLHEGKDNLGSWYRTYRSILEKGDRDVVETLGGILRLAEQLDCTESGTVADVRVTGSRRGLRISPRPRAEVAPEIAQANLNRRLLEASLGIPLQVV